MRSFRWLFGNMALSTEEKNNLPDSSFALILPGGEKDDSGRTVPRSNRKFPYKDADGKLLFENAVNALAILNGARGGTEVSDADKRKAWNTIVAAIKSERSDYQPPEQRFSIYDFPMPFPIMLAEHGHGIECNDNECPRHMDGMCDEMMKLDNVTDVEKQKLAEIRKKIKDKNHTKQDVAFVNMMMRKLNLAQLAASIPYYISDEFPHYPFKGDFKKFSTRLQHPLNLCSIAEQDCPCVGAVNLRHAAHSCDHAKHFGCPVFLQDTVYADPKMFESVFKFYDDGTATIDKYEVLSEGRWNGEDFSAAYLKQLSDNFSHLRGYLEVPVKIGHHSDQSLLTNSGEVAAGWFQNVWYEYTPKGCKLFSKVIGIPRKVALLMEKNGLRHRSLEIFRNFKDRTGKSIGPTIKALALLGVSTPAVKGMETLDDILSLYLADNNTADVLCVSLEEPKVSDQNQGKQYSQAEVDALIKKLSDEKDAQLKQQDAQIKALSATATALSNTVKLQQVEGSKIANERTYESLLGEGKLLPKQKDHFLMLMQMVDGVEDHLKAAKLESVYFTGLAWNPESIKLSVKEADDKGVISDRHYSIKDLIVKLFSIANKQVEFGTVSRDTDQKKQKDNADSGSNDGQQLMSDRAAELMAKDKALSFGDALALASKQLITEGKLTIADVIGEEIK